LGLCSPEELRQIAQLKLQASNRLVGTRDKLGTRRLLVVATDSGKLFGLHSGDGRVLWASTAPSQGLPVVDIRFFRLQHDPNLQPQARKAGVSGPGVALSSAASSFVQQEPVHCLP